MTREARKLRKHIEGHQGGPERQKLLKQAAKIRKAARQNQPRPLFDIRTIDQEDAGEQPVRSFQRNPRPKKILAQETRPGLVIGIGSGQCQLLCGNDPIEARRPPGLAVGDRVLISASGRIEEVLPRSATLSRPDPHNPRLARVIAANIDAVVIVASVRSPQLRPGLIDRYLIAIERGGGQSILCVNKLDLVEGENDLAPIDPYRMLGVPIFPCSAATGQGIAALEAALAGKLCVLVGHSGVGKSSLLNALSPELDLATQAVSEVHGKGRHTTSGSALYDLPNGARIIDTPGIREFGLWDMGPEELRGHFPEFAALAHRCGFPDCSHTHEPHCAVKQAMEAGEISPARYRSYCRILSSVGNLS